MKAKSRFADGRLKSCMHRNEAIGGEAGEVGVADAREVDGDAGAGGSRSFLDDSALGLAPGVRLLGAF